MVTIAPILPKQRQAAMSNPLAAERNYEEALQIAEQALLVARCALRDDGKPAIPGHRMAAIALSEVETALKKLGRL